MSQLYQPCPCNSGKKLKFCCNNFSKVGNLSNCTEEFYLKCPVRYCCTMKGFEEIGMASVLVARMLPDTTFMVGMYLVDLFCLGIKDAYVNTNVTSAGMAEIARNIANMGDDGLEELTYERARSVIFGGVEYAARFGFKPHSGWESAQMLIEPHRSFERTISFGKDGVPFYIVGPYDKNSQEIIRKVRAVGGHFMAEL